MNKNKNNHLQIDNNLKSLQYESVYENLFFYKYHSKYLKKLQKTKIDKEDPHFISTYSSFVGEVYENIVYELLVQYALKNENITQFVLKGPHQNRYKNLKNGLMIDINSQIVYKAGYKDVTEFDGLFFCDNSVYFVESTIVKTTTNLRKRLKKKKALLEILFPNKDIKALIILTKGAVGTTVFPNYCTIWLTDELIDDQLMQKLIVNKPNKQFEFKTHKNKKLIHCEKIKVNNFKYFETLLWILKKLISKKGIDMEFLTSKPIQTYLEVYSKFYIGYLSSKEFLKVLRYLNISHISEDIPLEQISEDKVLVTFEKTSKGDYILVYYLKIRNGDLKRLDVKDEILEVSKKDPKGFTSSEVKFMKFSFKNNCQLYFEDIKKVISDLE